MNEGFTWVNSWPRNPPWPDGAPFQFDDHPIIPYWELPRAVILSARHPVLFPFLRPSLIRGGERRKEEDRDKIA